MNKAGVNDSSGSSPEVVRHLVELLGDDVVLLWMYKGEKRPRWRRWQTTGIEVMFDKRYLENLAKDRNLSVLTGKPSGGLCTIDIDDDEAVEPFLVLNPRLRKTLRSQGQRGCNIWVRIEGSFPRSSFVKCSDGSAWGEWRSTGVCTTIHGVHPEGMSYTRSPEVPPVTMRFEDIQWPEGHVLPWKREDRNADPGILRDGAPQWTANDVREMLACIPARPDYDQWLRISSAVWSVLGEEEGTAVLNGWSPEEKPGEYEEKFKHRLERVTAGTLVHITKEHGWRGRRPVQPAQAPALDPTLNREEAVAQFFYDGAGKYHLDTDGQLVPMDQRSVVRHLKLWGFCNIHLDTEQSGGDWHALVRRSVKRSGLPAVSSRLVSIPLVRFARSERLAILEFALEKEQREQGGIDAVVIDGIADLCSSPNDEAESLELVSRLHALSQEYATAIICVLHENPFSDGKTRGHLGSELNRKAFANLRIDKDPETSISTMWGMDMRKRDIPLNLGFCFGWDIDAKMHIYQGRAAGIKAAKREKKLTEDARNRWISLFDFVAANGTNGSCPVLTPEEAVTAIRDMNGTKTKLKVETVKKQMQRATALGVLRKTERGKWTLNTSGQTGHE